VAGGSCRGEGRRGLAAVVETEMVACPCCTVSPTNLANVIADVVGTSGSGLARTVAMATQHSGDGHPNRGSVTWWRRAEVVGGGATWWSPVGELEAGQICRARRRRSG
jgi:hypothetical protein